MKRNIVSYCLSLIAMSVLFFGSVDAFAATLQWSTVKSVEINQSGDVSVILDVNENQSYILKDADDFENKTLSMLLTALTTQREVRLTTSAGTVTNVKMR